MTLFLRKSSADLALHTSRVIKIPEKEVHYAIPVSFYYRNSPHHNIPLLPSCIRLGGRGKVPVDRVVCFSIFQGRRW